MKYILTQFNFWNLAQYFSNCNHSFVYKKAPKRIIDFLKDNGVKIEQCSEKPEDAILVNGTYLDWPERKELNSDILIRKFHIDDDNYFAVLGSIKANDELIYTELSRKLPEGIKATCYKDRLDEAPKERIILSKAKKGNISALNDIRDGATVLHYVGRVVSTVKYRRLMLNDYLKEKYTVSTIYSGYEDSYLDGIQQVIISDPRESIELCVNARARNIPVYYDRTDNWSALYPGCEEWLREYATRITVSAEYLASIREDALLIPNGYNKWDYKENVKGPIAVYVGKASGKTDDEWVQKLMEANPNWEFISIGASIEGTIHVNLLPYDKMMSFISRARVGLIPLKADEYHRGQFNLKIWDYVQAHLYVIGHNTHNMDFVPNYTEVADEVPDLNSYAYDENKVIPEDYEWKNVLERIIGHYNREEDGQNGEEKDDGKR